MTAEDWHPDKVQQPDYPPPPRARDQERATAWQRLQAERAACNDLRDARGQSQSAEQEADDLGNERPVWPEGVTPAAREELLRCAEAFEATAARLRGIVGE